MARPRKFIAPLSDDEISMLQKIASSRSEELRKIQRANIILMANNGKTNREIADAVNLSEPSIVNTLKKWFSLGVESALEDMQRTGRPNIIDLADKSWVVSIACCFPKDLKDGPAAQQWTLSTLTNYVKKHCVDEDHPSLQNVSKSQIHAILNDNSLKPHKIKYYLVKKDEEFDKKAEDVLLVYKRVEWILQLTREHVSAGKRVDESCGEVIISDDEKPGIQAISSIAPDLEPDLQHGGTMARDYEYKRLGTLSLLAGIDLFTGEVVGIVREKHTSAEFIEFLKAVDNKYSDDLVIKIILDNLRVHTSKTVLEYLATRPGRFDFTFTPKHASWLNLIESFFSKLAKQSLRGLRVTSKKELVDHLNKWLDQVNADPVVYRWKWNVDDIWRGFTKRSTLIK